MLECLTAAASARRAYASGREYYTVHVDTLRRILVVLLVALLAATVYNGIFYLFYRFWPD
jgi:hypothetical protein